LEEKLLEIRNTEGMTEMELVKCYNDANKAVAILCNHQKGVARGHQESLAKLQLKFEAHEAELNATKEHLELLQKGSKREILKTDLFTKLPQTEQACRKQMGTLKDRMIKVHAEMSTRESNKNISLSTARVNYMDPRITIAFCKRTNLDIKHLFSTTIQSKFPWALAVGPDFQFRTETVKSFTEIVQETVKGMKDQGIRAEEESGNRSDDESQSVTTSKRQHGSARSVSSGTAATAATSKIVSVTKTGQATPKKKAPRARKKEKK